MFSNDIIIIPQQLSPQSKTPLIPVLQWKQVKTFISLYTLDLTVQSHYHLKYNLLENIFFFFFPLEVSSIQPKYLTVFIGNNSHNTSWILPSVLFVSVSTHILCVATLPFEFPLPWCCWVWGWFFRIVYSFGLWCVQLPQIAKLYYEWQKKTSVSFCSLLCLCLTLCVPRCEAFHRPDFLECCKVCWHKSDRQSVLQWEVCTWMYSVYHYMPDVHALCECASTQACLREDVLADLPKGKAVCLVSNRSQPVCV